MMFADLDGAHRDRARNVENRAAFVGTHDDGVAVSASGGSALAAAEMTEIFDAFVEAEFRNDAAERRERSGEDATTGPLARTARQRRFDALQTIFRAAAANSNSAPSLPATINLLVDQYTWEEHLAAHGLGDAPDPRHEPEERRCETDSGTPVLPDDVLRAALDGFIRRVVLDSSGRVIDYGRARRLFTGAARDAAKLLARRCDLPGCTVKKRYTQVDHNREWVRDRGPTDLANALNTCGPQNRHKSQRRLRASRTEAGTLNWYRADGTEIAPVGRRHLLDDDEIEAIWHTPMDELFERGGDMPRPMGQSSRGSSAGMR